MLAQKFSIFRIKLENNQTLEVEILVEGLTKFNF